MKIIALFLCLAGAASAQCRLTWLRHERQFVCAAFTGGSITTTGTFTTDALVTGSSSTAVKTPSATSTLDTSGNLSIAGGLSTNSACPTCAGTIIRKQGTAPNLGSYSNSMVEYGASSIATTFGVIMPSAAATGVRYWTNTSGTVTETIVAATGTGDFIRASYLSALASNPDAAGLTGTIDAARLPAPGATTKGGVEAETCSAGSHVSGIGIDGVPTCTVDTGAAPGATFFSTTGTTAVVAASATTLIGTVTGSKTIPAASFTAGSVLQILAQGHYTTPASARTLNIRVLIGGSARLSTGAFTVPASITEGVWRLDCGITTRTAGASGTQIGNCLLELSSGTLADTVVTMKSTATWTVDTTGTLAFDLDAAWDATTDAPTISSTNVAAWIPGSPISSIRLNNGSALTGEVVLTVPHVIAATFDGGGTALTAGETVAFCDTVPVGANGTIVAWIIHVDTGVATFKLWRNTSATTDPTIADSINTAGVAITTGTRVRSTTLTDFTSTAIAAGDNVCVNLSSVTDATKATFKVEIQ